MFDYLHQLWLRTDITCCFTKQVCSIYLQPWNQSVTTFHMGWHNVCPKLKTISNVMLSLSLHRCSIYQNYRLYKLEMSTWNMMTTLIISLDFFFFFFKSIYSKLSSLSPTMKQVLLSYVISAANKINDSCLNSSCRQLPRLLSKNSVSWSFKNTLSKACHPNPRPTHNQIIPKAKLSVLMFPKPKIMQNTSIGRIPRWNYKMQAVGDYDKIKNKYTCIRENTKWYEK